MDESRTPTTPATDSPNPQLLERLRAMQPGEMLRIPIMQEEVVVYKAPDCGGVDLQTRMLR
jgi:hypothetical protein